MRQYDHERTDCHISWDSFHHRNHAPNLSLPLWGPITVAEPRSQTPVQPNLLSVGALLELIMAAAIVAIAVLMHRILHSQIESLAVGYVASRIVVGVIFVVVAVLTLQLVLSLSAAFTSAGAPIPNDSSHRAGLRQSAHLLSLP